jgi:predicted transglutaminase-like cysteine proteinase
MRKPRATVILTALAIILLSTLPAQAGAPEWLRAAARAQLPAYPPETDAVVLFEEEVVTVLDTGEIKSTVRRAYKILRPEGRKYGVFGTHFNSETRILSIKGWSLPAKGSEYEVKDKDAIETGMSEDLYQDTKYKVLEIPAADPGNVVGYEYEQKRRPYALDDVWLFQKTVPVLHSRYALQLPAGWEHDVLWVNHPEVAPAGSGAYYAWEVRNVAAVEREDSMPSMADVAGWMAVRFYPRAGASVRTPSHRSWNDIGTWYNSLTADRRQASPEIKAKVAEITGGKASSLDKIRAIARFVQREVRYVSIQIGIGGYQPHPAPAVFSNKYGDCKDKATLFSTMLKEAGIESHYVVVRLGSRGAVRPQFPTLNAFNHVIVAIRLPADVQQSFGPELSHPQLGRILFFDPTDHITPLGNLPGSLQSNYGLLVTPSGGELVSMPLLPAARNAIERVAKLTLSPAGTLSGEVTETYTGLYASDRRWAYLQTPEPQRNKMIERFLGTFLSGVTLKSASTPDLETYADSLVVRYSFEATNYAKTAGNLLLVRPRVLGAKGEDVLEGKKPRKYPIEFEHAAVHTDVVEIQLPPGYVIDELPEPVNIDFGMAKYASKTELKGSVLHYGRTYQISDVMVRQEMFDKMKQFYRQIALDERSSAVLKKAP